MNILKLLAPLGLGIIIGYFLFTNKSNINSSQMIQAEQITPSSIPSKSKEQQTKQINNTSNKSIIDIKNSENIAKHLVREAKVNNIESKEEKDLALKYAKLEKQYSQSQQHIKSLTRQLGEFDESDVTNEELAEFVPKEYENLIVNFKGDTRNQISKLHNDPEDLDWGYEASNNITFFITTHAYSYGVNLQSLICKNSSCELLINEKERPSWDNIFQDMTKQDWWKFTSISSSSYDKDDNIYIYSFMSL